MSKDKQYGLIITKKDKSAVTTKRAKIFDDSSDDEQESVEKTIRNEALRTMQKKQTRLEIQKAINEDPTVYQYDSIYDDLQKKKEIRKVTKKKETAPKYIESLLKSAEHRKKEYERRTERKIQKERQEEGEEFADKEEFVTSSYKKKMEEMQKEEEEERKRSLIEERLDVTKQSDLSGFYRHLLKETTDEVPIKEEKVSSDEETKDPIVEQQPDLENIAQDIVQRSRENTTREKPGKEQQVDNDSEFSKDSESSSSDSSSSNSKTKNKRVSDKSHKSRKSRNGESDSNRPDKKGSVDRDIKAVAVASPNDVGVELPPTKELDEKAKQQSSVDRVRELFKKRNVGEAFEIAKEKYFARKAAREAAKSAFA